MLVRLAGYADAECCHKLSETSAPGGDGASEVNAYARLGVATRGERMSIGNWMSLHERMTYALSGAMPCTPTFGNDV